ncbi:MAG: 1-phosphofructokinase family hexose kinase [Chitinispirillaceae bacterium]
MGRIVTFTINPTIDVNFAVEKITPDRKLRGSRPVRQPGGGGINVSRALMRMGKVSNALFTRGGETGHLFSRMLEEEGIRYVPVQIMGLTREDYLVRERVSDTILRFTMPGPQLSEGELDACFDSVVSYVEKGDYLVMSGSLPPGAPDDFYARLVQNVGHRGVRCIVDTSGTPLKEAVESGVYLVKPNMHELAALYGEDIQNEKIQLKAAQSLIEEGKSQNVVLSLGAAGVLLVTREGHRRLRSPSVPIKSKVGAGDSMVAGIVYGLSEGFDMRTSVQYGIAAGAAAVMTPGTELCRDEDVKQLFSEISEE